MTPAQMILKELDNRRTALAAAKRNVELLEAELKGWEGAYAALQRAAPAPERPVQPKTDLPSPNFLGVTRQNLTTGFFSVQDEDPKRIKGRWQRLIAAAAQRYPNALSFDEWSAMADDLGEALSRETFRSQMSTYNKWGLVERIRDGVYRVSPAGAAAAGTSLPEAASDQTNTPDGSKDQGDDSMTEDGATD